MRNILKDYIQTLKTFNRDAIYYLIGNFIAGFGFTGFYLLFNLYMKEIGFGESSIGRVLSIGTYATVLLIFPAAFLIRKIPFKPILIIAPIITSLGYFIALSANSMINIMIGIFIAGGSNAFGSVISGPFIMKRSEAQNRTHLFSINQVTGLLSGITGNLIAGFLSSLIIKTGISPAIGYKIAIIIHILIASTSAFFYAKIQLSDFSQKTNISFFHIETSKKLLLKLAIPPMVVGLGAGMTVPFLNLYFRTQFGLKPHHIGLLFATGAFFTALGSLSSPLLANRYGKIRSVIISQLLSVPFLFILGISNWVWISIFAFLMRNALMNMAQPLVTNVALEIVKENDRALTSGIMTVAWLASWGITANVGGYLIEHYGYMLPFMTTVSLYILSSYLYHILLKKYEETV